MLIMLSTTCSAKGSVCHDSPTDPLDASLRNSNAQRECSRLGRKELNVKDKP